MSTSRAFLWTQCGSDSAPEKIKKTTWGSTSCNCQLNEYENAIEDRSRNAKDAEAKMAFGVI